MTLAFRQTFLFDHLPKTGGTALRSVLEDLLGRENVTPHLEGRSESWAIQRFSGFRVISGHFLSLLPSGGRNAGRVRLTLLRDPVDRAISEYFYWRHHAHEGVGDRLGELAQRYDVGDFFKARLESNETGASNFCTKHFASRISRNVKDADKLLALATQSLRNYGFVGIYEHLHDSVDMFCRQFGFPPAKQIPRVNVTASRIGVADLDKRTRRILTEMNDLDIQLYGLARAEFETKRRRMFRELVLKGSRLRRVRFGDSISGAAALLKGPFRRQRRLMSIDPGRQVPGSPPVAQATPVASDFEPSRRYESFGGKEVEIVAAQVIGADSGTNAVAPGESVLLCVSISAHADVPNLTVGMELSDSFGEVVFGTNTFHRRAIKAVSAGRDYDVAFRFAANLNRGRYDIGVALHTGADHTGHCFHWRDNVAKLEVVQYGEPDFIGYCRLEPTVEWWDAAHFAADECATTE